MVNKSIRKFSAPTTDNLCTRPAVDIDRTFELKPGLINMVQANQLCGKAHKDASAWRFASQSVMWEGTQTLLGDLQHIYYFRSS